jgi:peptidoglycan hydrolase CwlO-like protein
MKKLVFPLVVVVLLAWIFVSKCDNNSLFVEFKATQDSLNIVVDSLKEDNHQKDLQIGALEELDHDLQYQLDHQKAKVITITKWVDSSKGKVDTYSEEELITSFNTRYPEDTITNPLPIAQPVLVAAAKDLVELDGAKQTLVVKDSIIALNEERIFVKDSIIMKFEEKDSNSKIMIAVREKQIKDWQDQYGQLQAQNKKLKLRMQLTKIGAGLAIGGLTLLLVK